VPARAKPRTGRGLVYVCHMLGGFTRNARADLAAAAAPWLRRLSRAQRKALLCTLLSLVGWSLWNGLRDFDHPWGDLSRGQFSDHFSHMNAARVFPRVGRDIWRRPIDALFPRLTSAEMARLPRDLKRFGGLGGGFFEVPGWPADKPLLTSWPNKPRMYPPGDMLLVAPVALLYHYTGLSFSGACRLLIGLFIVTAHLALFLFFLTYFEQGSAIAWLICFFAYAQVMRWTLDGFYDPIAMVPLILCVRYSARRRGLAAVVAYCVGTVLHFRVFLQAPWVLWAAAQAMRDRFWRHLCWRRVLALGVAGLCAVLSLYVFALDWPTLGLVAINNPLHHAGLGADKAMTWSCRVVALVCALTFLSQRAWFDLATLGWLALAIFGLREFYPWHLLIAMSWLVAPARRQVVAGVRLAFLVTVVTIVFKDSFAPQWLWLLRHPALTMQM